jgi:hypothetical protein
MNAFAALDGGLPVAHLPISHDRSSQRVASSCPEDVILPYEWPQESDWYYRVFPVPAALLNQALGMVSREEAEHETT